MKKPKAKYFAALSLQSKSLNLLKSFLPVLNCDALGEVYWKHLSPNVKNYHKLLKLSQSVKILSDDYLLRDIMAEKYQQQAAFEAFKPYCVGKIIFIPFL